MSSMENTVTQNIGAGSCGKTAAETAVCRRRVKPVTIAKAVIGVLIAFITLFPIYWLFLISFRSSDSIKNGVSLLPTNLILSNYVELITKKGFDVALRNSLINSSIALVFSLLLGVSTAYILARKRFHVFYKQPLTIWVLIVRVLPPVAFVVPLYTMFTKLGLMGSRVPIILSCMLINIPLVIWFIISFFENLPESIEESAKIDGAGEFQLFTRIVLPLVLPGIAAVAMLSFLYAWNEYTYSVILTRSSSMYTVPLALAVLNTEDNVTNFGLVAAGGVASFLPVLLFVIFAQNYLISGLSSGAVKE